MLFLHHEVCKCYGFQFVIILELQLHKFLVHYCTYTLSKYVCTHLRTLHSLLQNQLQEVEIKAMYMCTCILRYT